ncbi:MAG: hypothetical protein HQ522_11945 [Bacteroidetes bacterium]|nr:hypothetical protein [Bacteroidota bacterium]
MVRKNISPLLLLCVLFASIVMSSCKKEFITEEPEVVYDKGERLTLNDKLVILENSRLTHGGGQQGILFDKPTGVVQFDVNSEIGVAMELDSGVVLNIDMGDDVLVRKITSMEIEGGEYILQTSVGSINDIFDNAKIGFDFSPGFSNQQLLTKSASLLVGEELSDALTDNNNRMHPTRVRLSDGVREITLFSIKDNIPLAATKSDDHTGMVGFDHQFNPQLYIPKLPITVGIEDFGFSFWTKLKADYHISKHYKYIDWPWPVGTQKTYDGATASFIVTAEDIDISAYIDLGIEAKGDVPLVDEDVPLFDPKELMFDFQCGPVPVIIGVELELIMNLDFKIGGELKIVSGVEVNYNIPEAQFGASETVTAGIPLRRNYGTTHEIKKGKFTVSPRPLRIEAMAKLTQNYSLRPSLGFSIYRTAGPELAFPLHAKYVVDIGAGESISLADTTEAPKAYVGWGADLSVSAGAKGGIWLDFIGFADKHLDIPEIPLTPSIPVWHTPNAMKLIENNHFANTVVGKGKEVEVRVTDSALLPAPLMPVIWEGGAGGSWKYPVTMTGLTGSTKNTWTPTKTGKHEPYCFVKNGMLIEKGRETFTTTTVTQ